MILYYVAWSLGCAALGYIFAIAIIYLAGLSSVAPAAPDRHSLSDDELVARVLAALYSDEVWLDQTLSAFVQIVQREERDAIAGVYSRDEATRRIESATLHFHRALLLRNLCVAAGTDPETQDEATP